MSNMRQLVKHAPASQTLKTSSEQHNPADNTEYREATSVDNNTVCTSRSSDVGGGWPLEPSAQAVPCRAYRPLRDAPL